MGGLLNENESARLSALVESIASNASNASSGPVFTRVSSELLALADAKVAIAFRLRIENGRETIDAFHASGCELSPAAFERFFHSAPGGFMTCLRASANVAGRATEMLGNAKHCRELIAALGAEECDALRVSVEVDRDVLAWIGVFRRKTFTCREAFVLESIVAALRARISPDDAEVRSALTAALDAIPAAACVVDAEGAIEEANDRARELLTHDQARMRKQLRHSVASATDSAPFAVTPLAVNGARPRFLAIERDRSAGVEVRVARAASTMQLSDRQIRVLSRLARGSSNKIIAESIGCSTKTVEVHVLSLLRKFGVRNRAELVAHFWTNL